MFDNLAGRSSSYHQQTTQLSASGGYARIRTFTNTFHHSKNSALINFHTIFPIFHPSRTAKSWIMREIFIHSATQSREKWCFWGVQQVTQLCWWARSFPSQCWRLRPTPAKLWYAFYGAFKWSMKFYSPNLCSSIASNDLKGFRGRRHIPVACLSKSQIRIVFRMEKQHNGRFSLRPSASLPLLSCSPSVVVLTTFRNAFCSRKCSLRWYVAFSKAFEKCCSTFAEIFTHFRSVPLHPTECDKVPARLSFFFACLGTHLTLQRERTTQRRGTQHKDFYNKHEFAERQISCSWISAIKASVNSFVFVFSDFMSRRNPSTLTFLCEKLLVQW